MKITNQYKPLARQPRPSFDQLYLLGYTREECIRSIYLEAIGVHENFYRDLKRQEINAFKP